jgi:hypothetical protein
MKTFVVPCGGVAMLACVLASPVLAGPKTKAAQEAAEYLLSKFGKEAAEQGTEKLATKLESLAVKNGDEVFEAARKVGPTAVKAVEEAGEQGSKVAKLLAREGDRALWVAENPQRVKLLAEYGDEAAEAMIKHKGIAEPLITELREPAAKALAALDPQQARQLAKLAEGGELAKIGRSSELLDTIARFGNRGMDFVWKNKGALAVSAVLAAFLADPEPFIDGSRELAETATTAVVAPVATHVAKDANWTWLGIVALLVLGGYGSVRYYVGRRFTRR